MADKEKKLESITEELSIEALSEDGAVIPEIKKNAEPVVIDEADYTDDEIRSEAQPEGKKKSKKKKAAKIIIAIICIILAICIGLYVAVFMYLRSLSNLVPEVEDTMTYDFDGEETVPVTLENDHVFEQIYEGDATELQASIKEWATKGEPMYDKDVINILCIGVDTRNKNTISGLTDSMVIASVNTELGTISFASIMRDCYAYLEDGNCFNKINSAFPFYGIESLMNTVESHFKIKLDGYAMINFAFFKAAIDKLGGVTVGLSEHEANYFNEYYGWDLQAGSAVNLNGDQALAFCRSRKIYADGDVQRTQNQREVLINILKKAATIKTSEIPEYVATFYPYFDTNYSENDIINLATKAVVGGWFTFDVQEMVVPAADARTPHSGSVWYWEVDYPLAAQQLQMFIYGKTNITLSEDR